jgi:hypothetical protein
MSWWNTEHDDDLVGDEAADRTAKALDRIAAERQKKGSPQPTLQQMLDGIAEALTRAQPGTKARVIAELEDGKQVIGESGHAAAPQDVSDALAEAFDDIAGFYKAYLEREPRPSELAACVDFVLSAEPESYLADGKGLSIRSITAEALP